MALGGCVRSLAGREFAENIAMWTKRVMLLLVAGACVGSTWAGNIRWQTRTENAVRAAQRHNKVLMFYALGSRREREDEIKDKQTRALADDRVVAAVQNMICVRLNIAQDAELLKRVGIRADESTNLTLFWTTADLQLLDRLSAGGVMQVDSILQKVEGVEKRQKQKVLKDILPILSDPESTDQQLQNALDTIAGLNLTGAADALGALLERENLNPRLRKDGYKLVGKFGTEQGVQILFQHSQSDNEEIAEAAMDGLGECDPPAARFLFEHLRSSDVDMQFAAYEAVAEIANVRGLRNRDFFEEAGRATRARELDRVKEKAVQRIERWERKNERRRR